MKSRDALVRLKRFQVDEKRRRVAQLQAMIAEFTRMANELNREIATEEQRANITDPNHFAYPTYARAARGRRDNITASLDNFRNQLAEAEEALNEATEEFNKAQNQEARDRSSIIDVVADRRAVDMTHALRRV